MPNQQIFCNSPWYELHIYWDGSLGFCCAAKHRSYPESQSNIYNVKNMTIRQWMDSEPMRQARLSMFGDAKNSICTRCYEDETMGTTSRRHRANQKSVIFTRTAFDVSYTQSPSHGIFEYSRRSHGAHSGEPIDIHIDLGNYCNLACKMCSPMASSKIASQHVRWGIDDARPFLNQDWTRDQETWNRVLTELADIPDLLNVHFMGGETLITSRLEEFIDFMISRGRFDLNFSFVTNGTVFNEGLMQKLKAFNRVGIEISVESLDATNSYTRQGTDQVSLMKNLAKYMAWCDVEKTSVTLRPAISALTIGSYHTLLNFAYQNKLIVKHLVVQTPRYLDVKILPEEIKQQYLTRYDALSASLGVQDQDITADFNESYPHEYCRVIANQIKICQSLLCNPSPADAEHLRAELVIWCRRWDDVYGYDARKIYPEFLDMLDQHGY